MASRLVSSLGRIHMKSRGTGRGSRSLGSVDVIDYPPDVGIFDQVDADLFEDLRGIFDDPQLSDGRTGRKWYSGRSRV